MVEPIPGLPDNVVGVSATGKVTSKDYESVIIPAVERVLAEHGRSRFLYHLGEGFDGFEAGAMWDDARLGLAHPTSWERIAVVTDVDWLRIATQALGLVMPGHVKVFRNAELDEAKQWISA